MGACCCPVIVKVGGGREVKVHVGETASALWPLYNGPWTVTPLAARETVLLTRQKSVDRDITVEAIPYAEVSNIKGGLTATIGG